MEVLQELVQKAFAVDSVWSIVVRGLVWLGVVVVIIMSTDRPDPQASAKSLKANLGFFLLFLTLSGGLIYWLFGFTSTG